MIGADLLMYEKGLVTLKGVLADVDPTLMFDLQKVIGWFLLDVGRLWRKLPKQ